MMRTALLLRAATLLALAAALSGCALLLEEGALVEAGAGTGAAETSAMAAEGGVANSVLVSDEVAASFRSVRFSSNLRGPLSDSLAELTGDGERSAWLDIDRRGIISGNGYRVARLSPQNGIIYSPRGLRLGYVNREGVLVEYLRSGRTRSIGAVRGFIGGRPATVFADSTFRKRIGSIPANGMVRVSRIGEAGYLVQLESEEMGWIPVAVIRLVSILGIDQLIHTCGAQPGAIVTKSNRLVRYDRCRTSASGDDLVQRGSVVHVPADSISQIWEGGVGQPTNSSLRLAAIHSLRTDGLLYPVKSEYDLYPEGDPRSKGARTPG